MEVFSPASARLGRIGGHQPERRDRACGNDRLVREVIFFPRQRRKSGECRHADRRSTSMRDRDLWLRRAERLRQGAVALHAALDELNSASQSTSRR